MVAMSYERFLRLVRAMLALREADAVLPVAEVKKPREVS